MSIDLGHPADSDEDHNAAAAQSVSHSIFRNILLSCDTCSVTSLWVTFFFFWPRTSYSYRCLDARFYDDETLTVVLEGLEEEDRSHVLAQIPLASALSCETEFIWDPKMRYVGVFEILVIVISEVCYSLVVRELLEQPVT